MKNNISCIEELDEEDTTKIKSVAFGEISIILYNMKSFSVDFKLVKVLSFKLCKLFNIRVYFKYNGLDSQKLFL